jgi:hypothetical protein
MKTHAIVVLSDGETWNTLDGCSIVVIDDVQFRDLCEDRVNAGDLVAISEISLIGHTPKKASPERIITGDRDPATGTEYGTLS